MEDGDGTSTGTVTFWMTDIEGSTRLLQELGPHYADVLADHHAIIRAVVGAGGGSEVDTEGDAFFCVFHSVRGAVEAAAQAERGLASQLLARRPPCAGADGPAHRRGATVQHRLRRPRRPPHGEGHLRRARRSGRRDRNDAGAHGGGLAPRRGLRLPGLAPTQGPGLPRAAVPARDRGSSCPAPRPCAAWKRRAGHLLFTQSSFVGRSREVADLARLVDEHRRATPHRTGRCGQDPARAP